MNVSPANVVVPKVKAPATSITPRVAREAVRSGVGAVPRAPVTILLCTKLTVPALLISTRIRQAWPAVSAVSVPTEMLSWAALR